MSPEVALAVGVSVAGLVAYFVRGRDMKLDDAVARIVCLERDVALLKLRDEHHDSRFAAILAKLDAIENLLRGRGSVHED
jgi:hypothetical protein